jgi:hypothetical protein
MNKVRAIKTSLVNKILKSRVNSNRVKVMKMKMNNNPNSRLHLLHHHK